MFGLFFNLNCEKDTNLDVPKKRKGIVSFFLGNAFHFILFYFMFDVIRVMTVHGDITKNRHLEYFCVSCKRRE